MLRHTVATLAYRGGKAVRGAPEGFSEFRAGKTSRSAGEILAHVGDLLDWALVMARKKHEWHDSEPLAWDKEVQRFFAALEALDEYLASGNPLRSEPEKLFQGPIADALTHIGQIAMLRRLARAPVRGENDLRAKIVMGRVGPRQAAPVKEFE